MRKLFTYSNHRVFKINQSCAVVYTPETKSRIWQRELVIKLFGRTLTIKGKERIGAWR